MENILDHITCEELEDRWRRCRELIISRVPEAGGLMVFSRINIYYLTGSFANGVFWLPLDGKPLLLCRRGLSRAHLESPVKDILPFHRYGEIPDLCSRAGSPFSSHVAAERGGLSWALSLSLARQLPETSFFSCDALLASVRAVKSEREITLLRTAGNRHSFSLDSLLAHVISPGMTEAEISRHLLEIFLAQGHQGMLRMQGYGEEFFLGHVSAGTSALYPSVLNGPVGLRGFHPAVPHMGSPHITWEDEELLTIDTGFMFEGYQTDKTKVYWSGKRDKLPDKVRAAHDFCIDVQSRTAELLRPGSSPDDLWSLAAARAAESEWVEGFMGLGNNKVNFLGHGIGLAIDEFPAVAAGVDATLEEGMVIALEPKVGLPGIGMVGVENTFEVTAEGGKSLTGHEFDIIFVS